MYQVNFNLHFQNLKVDLTGIWIFSGSGFQLETLLDVWEIQLEAFQHLQLLEDFSPSTSSGSLT
jgi:hypothetical protein